MEELADIIKRASLSRQGIDHPMSTGTMSHLYDDSIKKRMEDAGVFRRYEKCTFENIESRGIPAEVAEQYKQVAGYAENLKSNLDEGKGLLLKGSVGTLKTTMAVAVLQKQIQQGGYGMFITMASLLDNLFSLKNEERREHEQRIKNTPLLVLDDLGAEHTEGWVLTKVDAIIAERYNRCKSIIITTNLSADQLSKTYAERIIDRIRSTMTVVNFAGKSQRERVL